VEKTKDLPFRKNEFLSQLKALHIGEWKSHYDRLALDGTQWHLGIYFSNFHEDVEIYGSNAYPIILINSASLWKSAGFSGQDKGAKNRVLAFLFWVKNYLFKFKCGILYCIYLYRST
jgi:hypothetical protein